MLDSRRQMFQWTARRVALPVGLPAKGQRTVQADVRVVEATTPCYALMFSVAVFASDGKFLRVERRVTKQHMAHVFEQVVTQPTTGVATMRTRNFNPKTVQKNAFDGDVDRTMLQWLEGLSDNPPTREQLVQWLLSRMFLLHQASGEWKVVICGEIVESTLQENDQVTESSQASSSNTSVETILLQADDEHRPVSPPPPPYSAESSSRSLRATSDGSELSDFGDFEENGDEGAVGEVEGEEEEEEEEEEEQPVSDTEAHSDHQVAGQRSYQVKVQDQKDETATTVQVNGSRRSSRRDENDGGVGPDAPSKYRFEPASTRLRHSSSSGSLRSSNAWTEERHHFQLELSLSKRDIDIAQERQRKAEVIASLKRQQLIDKSQKKMLAHEQKLRDSRFVKQSIADTLEYHTISHRLESQLKQTRISASREQERLVQTMRVAIGRSGEKWQKGPVLGSGPLSQIEIDLLTRSRDKHQSSTSMWVYDLHGRRHSGSEAGVLASESAFETAMKKIQVLLERKASDSVNLFRKYDLNSSGTLEYGEFELLLQENRVTLTKEQAKTLFRHFDPNRSGAIDYGELLWGFFNRRAFLKRWQLRKTRLSAREIKMMFYKYDRVGRGALSPVDFQLALGDIGFRVSETEAQLLCLKFDTNKDGFIDYNEFHAFVNDDDDQSGVDETMRRSVSSSSKVSSLTLSAAPTASRTDTKRGKELTLKNRGLEPTRIERKPRQREAEGSHDMSRILAELRALHETHDEIQRAIASRD